MRPGMSQLAMLACSLAFSVSAVAETGNEIIEDSGVRGGLVVHIGCGDAKLTAALQVNDSYIVQGLDVDGKAIQIAQRRVPGAKVIQRKVDTHCLHRLKNLDVGVRVVHDHTLSDLDHQLRGLGFGLGQYPLQRMHQ